jgi:hypothetical protein
MSMSVDWTRTEDGNQRATVGQGSHTARIIVALQQESPPDQRWSYAVDLVEGKRFRTRRGTAATEERAKDAALSTAHDFLQHAASG